MLHFLGKKMSLLVFEKIEPKKRSAKHHQKEGYVSNFRWTAPKKKISNWWNFNIYPPFKTTIVSNKKHHEQTGKIPTCPTKKKESRISCPHIPMAFEGPDLDSSSGPILGHTCWVSLFLIGLPKSPSAYPPPKKQTFVLRKNCGNAHILPAFPFKWYLHISYHFKLLNMKLFHHPSIQQNGERCGVEFPYVPRSKLLIMAI